MKNRKEMKEIQAKVHTAVENRVKTKIQTKIIALVVIAIICVSTVSSILSKLVTDYSTTAAIERTVRETAEVAALAAENMISTYTLTISEIGSNPTLTDANITLGAKQTYIQSRVDAYGMRFGGMADLNGLDAYHQIDVSQEPFFLTARTGERYISTPYIDGDDMYIMVSAPIEQYGIIIGVVYFQCDTYLLDQIINHLQVGENGECYILDKNGTTIACTDRSAVLRQENAIQESKENPKDRDMAAIAVIERKMIAGESGVASYSYHADSSRNIQGYAPISGTDSWSIAVGVDTEEFMRPAYYGSLFQTVACVAACIIVVILSAVISRSIVLPIVHCAERLQKLAAGDLTSPVPSGRGRDETRVLSDSTAKLVEDLHGITGEIGRVLDAIANGDLTQESDPQYFPGDFAALQNSLQVIGKRLNKTIAGIVRASGEVANSSEQVASAGAELSRGAAEQTDAMQQLVSTIETMNSDAEKTDELTRQTKDALDGAGLKVRQSREYIDNLNRAMDQITESSDEISRIIDTIENIAFQTNILALNAAVEAARAGAAGKGFAVVADEVRNLANKSDEAAKSTHELIKRSAEAVESGSRVVSQVTQSVADMAALSAQAVEQMDIAAGAVDTQAGAIEQVTKNIDQIYSIIQSNSTAAERSAATSQELAGQSETLTQLVASFRLRPKKNKR